MLYDPLQPHIKKEKKQSVCVRDMMDIAYSQMVQLNNNLCVWRERERKREQIWQNVENSEPG